MLMPMMRSQSWRDTGIVEQQVDPAVFGHHIVSQGFHGGGITDIRHVLGDL
jgi:hypothetical protein